VSPSAPPTDGELLRRAADRDREAFSTLYVRYEAIVAGYLVRRTRDPDLAADLTAETFAAAVLGARGFRDEGQSAIGWLLGSRATCWRARGSAARPNGAPARGSGSSGSPRATPRWSASRR
jgi:hypothetical protein